MKTIQLSDILEKPSLSLDQLLEIDIEYFEYSIDCTKLAKPDYSVESLGYVSEILPMIHEIMQINKPCIYWFELDNKNDANDVIGDFERYKSSNPTVSLPPINYSKIKYHLSDCLYVGVRQKGMRKKDNFSNIAGRIAIHFGYYKVKTTQGVNFAHWCKHKIKVKVIALPEYADLYLNFIEKLLSLQLKPLFGRY